MASGGMTDVQREGDGGLGSWNPALRPNSGIGEPSHAPENETVEEVIVSEKHGVDTGDELSYAWEQEARTLDHDRQLPRSQSNSFPEVPPLNATESFCFPQQLPQSQAEDVMEVVEEPWNPANHNFTGEDDDGTPDYFGDSGDGGAYDFYTEINGFQGDVLGMPGDDEARFEEGLPLMPSEPKRTSSIQNELDWTEQTAASGMEELSSDVSSRLPTSDSPVEETPSFKPQPLDRKTTSQVLGSLHYASENDSPLGESFDVPELVDAYPPGHNDATVVPENLGEPVSTVEDSTTLLPAEQPPSDHDQDLAALWEAAMGDDDLLEEDPSSVDPSTFFEDDGAGFLVNGSHEESAAIQLTQSSQSAPPESTSGTSPSNFATSGFTIAPTQPMYNSGPTSSQRPGMLGRAQSYADKSKGGYTSPYDLPMDLRRPKKRINVHQVNPGPSSPPFPPRPPPPPRSSSMQSQRPTPQVASSTYPATSHVPPSTFTPPVAQAQVTSPSTVVPSLKPKASNSSFFEELPIVAKVRSSSSVGRSTPQPTQTLLPLPPQVPPQGRHTSLPSTMQPQNSNSYRPSSTYQLLPPERIDPYANVPHQAPTTVPVPAIATRYSPAPPSQGMVPTGRNRYATPPTNASRAPPPQTLPFQPRTSSPLAHSGSSAQKLQRFSEIAAPAIENEQALQQEYSHRNASEDSTLCQPGQTSMGLGLAHTYHSEEEIATAPGAARSLTRHSTSPAINSRYAASSNSQSQPPHHARIPSLDDPQAQRSPSEYHPQRQSQGLLQGMGLDPPKRSQTISPGAIKGRRDLHTSYREPYQRPASSNDHALQPPATSAYSIAHVQAAGRAKGFSQNQDYIQPSDGREFDPLERWKGSPILAFGFGGTVVTTFPKRIPRYSAGQSMPMLKCSPGEIKVRTDKVFPLDELIASFPGPLRSKGKKKDVLEWLRKRIQTFEIEHESIAPSPALPDPLRRHGEKVMLWQILLALVEHDGVIEGNPAALDTVRKIFSPELSADNSSDQTSDGADSKLIGISRSDGMKSSSDPVDSGALEVVRTALLKGEREKAVWLAVDKRLWAHAMLISSTMSKDIWKQVVQEFVRNEVKPFGDNTESLAALYEVFAGNWEGSIDELVPPSARAGLQMVSKAAVPGPTRNALDGLDRWRETLSLILSNRSPGDAQALVALGQLLAGYGRIEAAHICYIFAKPQGVFSGVDDSQLGVSLLGAGKSQQTFEQSHDLDSLLLTEVYEFALSVLTPSAVSTVSPHLQSYKLYHAMVLAEYGYRSEAQQYCDTITATLKSTTKPSPYYHSQLFSALDELTNRLKQAPKDGSASWISKPSMEKVSGSVWARFNSFVAGENSDPASVGSGKGVDPGAGPFAKITGDSPTISRSPSASDLYSYSASAGVVPIPASGATISHSRYAPSGTYTPRSSLEQPGRSSQDSPRPMPYEVLKPPSTQRPSSYQPIPTDLYQQPEPDVYKSKSQASVYSPPTNGYLPTPPSQPEYMPIAPPEEFSTTLDQQDSCQPSAPMQQPPFESVSRPLHESSPYSSYEPPRPSQDSPASNTYQPPSDASEPHSSSGYEPPSYDPLSSNGYDPPSYNPETQEDEASPTQEKPKKKSFMDDDEDDFATRAAAILKKEKAQKDRAADEAFRKAAEADAKKDPHPGAKKGWLGGWFGGKKEADMSSSSAPASGPIRAKLGEENSFYYDTQLKKWINKKAGASTETVARATPPPPRSVPSAGHESGISKPPPIALPSSSGPPSGTSTPARSESPAAVGTGGSSLSGEGRSTLAPPLPVSGPPSGPPSSPPSRPSTAMRTDSSIDDLIGAPQARKGGTIKKGKKGRGYVDVMAAK
ncbi:Sec16, central conserved domain [Lasallia pustulata]|uniref:Protein transport protein sec16 n=1 Tax=Lasallia pustulata TaxID=136370 RepID=A0A1W5D1A4_9LECA|nr:Sec16, central conserved domain [Lasallia pustulata]